MVSLICADASLALKLVLNEPDSTVARTLWDEWRTQQAIVIAPTLWAYEVSSVVRNRTHRGLLPPEEEAGAFTALHLLPVQLLRPDGLHQRAWEFARHFDRPAAYDAHYLALAEMAGCPFWTADERLYDRVHAELDWVHRLRDYQSSGISG